MASLKQNIFLKLNTFFWKYISQAKYISQKISTEKECVWNSRPWTQVSMGRWKMVWAADSKWPSHFVKIKPNVVFEPDISNLILLERGKFHEIPLSIVFFISSLLAKLGFLVDNPPHLSEHSNDSDLLGQLAPFRI